MNVGKRIIKHCYYCGGASTSKEHVPPKCIYEPPRPTDLITVPSCAKHNNHKSGDDLYLKTYILFAASNQPSDIVNKRLETIYQRLSRDESLGFLKKIMRSARTVPKISPAGVICGVEREFEYDPARMHRIFEAICRGIFYDQHKQMMPEKAVFERPYIYEGNNPNIEWISSVLPTSRSVGNGRIFRYSYGQLHSRPEEMVWNLIFYNTVKVVCMTRCAGRKRKTY
jgi:hypothetical protein